MYVHIGGEYTILVSSVIAMVNLETVQPSSLDMKSFLKNQEEEKILEYVSEELPRSLVITNDRAYVSPLSVATLFKRMGNTDFAP